MPVRFFLYELYDLGFYGPLWWSAFAAVAFAAARYGRWWGVVAGQIVVGLLILWIDAAWIDGQMRSPGYRERLVPDMDAAFAPGVIVRILLVNALLLPVSAAGVWLSRRAARLRTVRN